MTAPSSKPVVSIISSIEREWCDLMDPFITALENQQDVDAAALEVIVVDGYGDKHLAEEIAKKNEIYDGPLRLQLFSVDPCGRAAALNRGIERSQSDLLLLLADDFIATPTLLQQHLHLHQEDPEQNVVGIGPGIFPPDWKLSPYMRWLDYGGGLFGFSFIGDKAEPPPPTFFYGANTSLKRAFLDRAGLFDEDFPYDTGDDGEMGYRLNRLGMRSVYLPEAIAHHWHEQGLPDGLERARLSGESAAIMDFKIGGPERLKSGVARRRKTRRQPPKNLEQRWAAALTDEFNKAYKLAAQNLITRDSAK